MAKPERPGSAPAPRRGRGFSATADGLSLEQLLELVRLRQLTARLTVSSADGSVGELRCRRGQLVGGSIAGQTGPGAIATVLSLPGGEVTLEVDAHPEPLAPSPPGSAAGEPGRQRPAATAVDRMLPVLYAGGSPREPRASRAEPRRASSAWWLLALPLLALGGYALGARQSERSESAAPQATALELRPAEPPRSPAPPTPAALATPAALPAPAPSVALEPPPVERAAVPARGPELSAPELPAVLGAPTPRRDEAARAAPAPPAPRRPRPPAPRRAPAPLPPAARAAPAPALVSRPSAPPAPALPRVRILEDERPKARVLE